MAFLQKNNLFCKVAEQKKQHMDFCTFNRFILFKTNELLEKHPNYLDMALSKAECSDIKSRNGLQLSW